MAVTSHAVLLLSVLTCTAPLALLQAADTHLHFFLHDVQSGTNPTAVQVIKGPAASGAIPGMNFGDTIVLDDALTETSSATSTPVGRAQGFYMMSSQSGVAMMSCVNLILSTGDYNGSTIAVIGGDHVTSTMGELAVVGGTGTFRMATGYVLWKTISTNAADYTAELDVYTTTPNGRN